MCDVCLQEAVVQLLCALSQQQFASATLLVHLRPLSKHLVAALQHQAPLGFSGRAQFYTVQVLAQLHQVVAADMLLLAAVWVPNVWHPMLAVSPSAQVGAGIQLSVLVPGILVCSQKC